MTLTYMAICLLLPFIALGVIYTFRSELRSDHVEDVCGSLYEEVNTRSAISLMYPIWFLVRRLVFVIIAVLLADYPGTIHLIYLVLQQLLHVLFLMLVKPFENPFMNKMEIFNELCILGIVYHFFLFFDFVPDEDI